MSPVDIVQARAKDQKEELEEIGKVYQTITKMFERAPKKETVSSLQLLTVSFQFNRAVF